MSFALKTVLVVDDMKMVRMRLRLILGDLEVGQILEAADGVEALSVLRSKKVDLVLSDWNMPNMTGVQLLEAMRADQALLDMPVIFITSESQKTAIVQTADLGVTEFVVKPFTDEQVKQKVSAVLGG